MRHADRELSRGMTHSLYHLPRHHQKQQKKKEHGRVNPTAAVAPVITTELPKNRPKKKGFTSHPTHTEALKCVLVGGGERAAAAAAAGASRIKMAGRLRPCTWAAAAPRHTLAHAALYAYIHSPRKPGLPRVPGRTRASAGSRARTYTE